MMIFSPRERFFNEAMTAFGFGLVWFGLDLAAI